MTILFLSRLFYSHIGGVEKHVFEISKQLIKKGHKVIVITEQYDKHLKTQEIFQNIEIYRIPIRSQNWFKKFYIWQWMFYHQKLIKNADIVHTHDVFFWYLPFRFLYPKKKVFTTFHGYETKFPPSKKAILVRKFSEVLSSGNIIVGEYIAKWYGTKTKFVTYGGIRELGIRNQELGIKENKKLRILLVGRLEQDIGVPIYLQALDELNKRGFQYAFETCGDGTLKTQVEKYGEVYGFVEDLSDFIKKADIVFCSSYLSILEALAAKKPVFSVYTNSLKEDYLKKSPFAKYIVIEDSAKNIADKIMRYKEFKDTIEKAYTFAKKQTWENVCNLYLKLWNI